MAVMVALGDTLLTELLISQNTTAEHVARIKQIKEGGGGGGGGPPETQIFERAFFFSPFN